MASSQFDHRKLEAEAGERDHGFETGHDRGIAGRCAAGPETGESAVLLEIEDVPDRRAREIARQLHREVEAAGGGREHFAHEYRPVGPITRFAAGDRDVGIESVARVELDHEIGAERSAGAAAEPATERHEQVAGDRHMRIRTAGHHDEPALDHLVPGRPPLRPCDEGLRGGEIGWDERGGHGTFPSRTLRTPAPRRRAGKARRLGRVVLGALTGRRSGL